MKFAYVALMKSCIHRYVGHWFKSTTAIMPLADLLLRSRGPEELDRFHHFLHGPGPLSEPKDGRPSLLRDAACRATHTTPRIKRDAGETR